jgi:hypothetical protein
MLMMVIYWEKTHITEKTTEALLQARKRFILNVNAEKTSY